MSVYPYEKYYDISGNETNSIELAYSKVIFKSHDFKFYVKKIGTRGFFRKKHIVWEFHHSSSTFGSWMWPEGLPLRFDGVDNEKLSKEHADKIGSTWGFKKER